MGTGEAVTDPQRLRAAAHHVIAATAADIRAVADLAERGVVSQDNQGARWRSSGSGDGVYAAHVQIATGTYGYLGDLEDHIAGWDPTMARRIADWLADIAERHGPARYDCYYCADFLVQDCRDLVAALGMCAAWRPEPKGASADA